MTEHDIQNEIRAAVSPYAVIFRINVGSGRTADGRFFSTGVPPGFSDLFGVRRKDGRAIFIEVKKPGGKVTDRQKNFLERMKKIGAVTGIAHSTEEAIRLITEE